MGVYGLFFHISYIPSINSTSREKAAFFSDEAFTCIHVLLLVHTPTQTILNPSTHRALGTTSLDPKISRRVNLDYTLSACSEFSKLVNEGKKFRFVYCSGALATRDRGKKLWFLSEMRKIRVTPPIPTGFPDSIPSPFPYRPK